MMSLNFGVKAGTSIAYVEMFGMKTDSIYTMSKDNQRLEIEWGDRKDEEIINSVADYRKHFVDIGDGAKTFITEYDTIEYLSENLKNVTERVKIRGDVRKEPYITKSGEHTIVDHYVITSVYLAGDTDRTGLYIDLELYYNKDSIDIDKNKNKTIIDGYIRQFIRNSPNINKAIGDAGKQFFIPQTVVLSLQNDDLYEALLNEVELTNRKLHYMRWRCKLISGAEEVEFDESQLTEKQKKMIKLGLAQVDDYKPRGNIYGPRIYELRLYRPMFLNGFADGVIEADVTYDELQEELIHFEEKEKFEDVVRKSKEESDDDLPFNLNDFEDDFEG